MSEAEGASATCATFLEMLKTLPWCKQGDDVLVAVHKITPEVIEVIKDLGANVYPGGIHVKLNKSFLTDLQNKFDDGQPLPAVLVWKTQMLKSGIDARAQMTFLMTPGQVQLAHQPKKNAVLISAETLGADSMTAHLDLVSKAKECPAMIPPQ